MRASTHTATSLDAADPQPIHVSIPTTSNEKETLAGALTHTYTAFRIHVLCENQGEWTVLRRYSEFLELHKKLTKSFPEVLTGLATFPKKKLSLRPENITVEERRVFFETYLRALIELEPRPNLIGSFIELWHRKPVSIPRLADFEIVKTLGGGNFGRVFLVHHNNTSFAMKVLKKDMIVRKKQVEHVLTEREVGSTLHNHPFIVPVLYSYQTEHRLYMISEFCQGGDLFFHLKSMRQFSESTTKFYSAQIFLGLEFLHSLQIVYRDLKPENVMLDDRGDAKLTDFGLSKFKVDDFSGAKTFCGTPEYLAPEILEMKNGQGDYGYSVDFWCLGNFICELLTGYPPFVAENPREMRRRILTEEVKISNSTSLKLQNLIHGLLQRKPSDRLTSAQIKAHPFWTVPWDDVYEKVNVPPIRPSLDAQDETVNFDGSSSEDSPAQTPRRLTDVDCELDLTKMFKTFAVDQGWEQAIKEDYQYVWGGEESQSLEEAKD